MKKKGILLVLLSITITVVIILLVGNFDRIADEKDKIIADEQQTNLYVPTEYEEPPLDSLTQAFIEEFTEKVRKDDRKAVAQMISYPLYQPYPLKHIQNAKELIKHYDRVFPHWHRQALDTSTISDWSGMGWRGVMFRNGDIWIDMFDNGVLVRSIHSDVHDNHLMTQDVEEARKREREMMGIDSPHLIPFAAYLSKDSTTLIHFKGDSIDKKCYATIYYNPAKIQKELQTSAKVQLECNHRVDGSCANDFYTAVLGDDTIDIWDMNCGGFDTMEEYAYGFHVKADTTSQAKNLLDTIGTKYNADVDMYGYFGMRPIYLQDIIQ